jgi:tetratricopeptide (TPR) repeat protein
MGESLGILELAAIIGIPSALVTLYVAVMEIEDRSKRRAFRNIGDFFSSDELKGNKDQDHKLSENFKEKFCTNLLKHSVSEWNDSYLWTDRNQRVMDRLQRQEKVLIVGPSGLGKTRLVLEVLRKLVNEENSSFEKMLVVAIKDSPKTEDYPIIRNSFGRKWSRVILFFDDLERFLGKFDINELVLKFRNVSKNINIVATCRSEEFIDISEEREVTTLFSKEDIIDLWLYTKNEGIEMASKVNKPFPEDFSGTADQIVLDKLRKKDIYRNGLNDDEKAVLKSAKLLRLCLISTFSVNLLESVWKNVFQCKSNWDSCLNKVVNSHGFLNPSSISGKFSIPDAYLDTKKGIVFDYPVYNSSLLEHAKILEEILFKQKSLDEIFSIGLFFGFSESHDQALSCFDFFVTLKPESPLGWLNKGVALDKLKRPDEALNCFAKAIELKPDYVSAWFNKGATFDDLERYDEALNCYSKVVELKPDYADAWFNKGVMLGRMGKHDEALNCFAKAIELKPDYVEAWFNKGVAFENLKRYDEALNCYSKVVELKPDYAEAWLNKGVILSKLERPDEALNCFAKAIELKPDYPDAWFSKGIALNKLKRPDEALNSYSKAVELKPDYADAWFNKGVTLRKLERSDEALFCYSKAIVLRPDDACAWLNKGITLRSLKRSDEALNCFAKAIELKPDYVEAWINKGIAFDNLERYDEALNCFIKVVELKPDYVEAWVNEGITLNNLKRPDEALNCFAKAIELKPDYADAWLNKGFILGRQERYGEALNSYSKAVELKPNDADIWLGKAILLTRLERYGEALNCFAKAIELKPREVLIRMDIAETYLLTDHYRKCLEEIEIARPLIETTEEEAIALSMIAISYHLMGEKKKAEAAYNKALVYINSLGGQVETNWDFYQLSQKIEKAKADYENKLVLLLSLFKKK